MGTNYYYVSQEDTCQSCGHKLPSPIQKKQHMGKSSAGWFYLLRTHKGIEGLAKWLHYMNTNAGYIEDEYGRRKTTVNWLNIVLDRRRDGVRPYIVADDGKKLHEEYGLWYDPTLQTGDGPYSLCYAEFS
jgi:hypothetical protein